MVEYSDFQLDRNNSRSMGMVSYSHKDEVWLKDMLTFFKPLLREGTIYLWSDLIIKPGQLWEREIEQALSQAKFAIFFVSPDFLASDFIHYKELPLLLEGARERGLRILPVLLKPCLYEDCPLKSFQSVNDLKKPLIDASETEKNLIWNKLAQAIKDSLGKPPFNVEQKYTDSFSNSQESNLAVETDKQTVDLELTIPGTLDKFSDAQKAEVLEAICKLAGVSDLKIKSLREGSIKLTVELPPHLAERVMWAIKRGELEDINVQDANIVEEIADGLQDISRGSGMETWQVESLRRTLEGNKQLSTLTGMMNAAGNPTRMAILYLLWRLKEVRVNDMASVLQLTSPAISQQLKKLKKQSMVEHRTDNQTVYYRLSDSSAFVQHFLSRFFDQELLYREIRGEQTRMDALRVNMANDNAESSINEKTGGVKYKFKVSGLATNQIESLRRTLEGNKQLSTLTGMMNAAGNPTRMAILYLLWRLKEVRVNDMASVLQLTSPAISQQLKKLKKQSMVEYRRDIHTIYYRLSDSSAFIEHFLSRFFSSM